MALYLIIGMLVIQSEGKTRGIKFGESGYLWGCLVLDVIMWPYYAFDRILSKKKQFMRR